MKKQTLIFSLLIIATQLFAQVPNYVPTNGLVGWWGFNGNANDESGNGNNGTVNGATLTTDRNGNANKAYSFDGVNDFINCSSSNIPTTGVVSISVWLKPFQNNGIAEYICLGSPSSTTWGTLAGINWNGSPYLNMNYGRGCSGTGTSVVAVAPTLNDWQNITYVSLGVNSTCNVYLNGIYIGQATNGNIGSCVSSNLYFGVNIFGGEHINCELDDIGIWNRALTQQEITALYNGCTTPPTATITPQSSTTFCQGSNVVLQASGGNSYNWSNGVTTQSITVTQGNTYTVTVTDGNNCTASASQVVTVNPIPAINFSLPSFISNTVNNFSLSATPTGGTFSGTGVNGNVFNASQAGLGNKTIDYSVTVNNCSNTASANTIVYDTTGLVCTTRDTITTFISVTDTLLIDVTITGLTPPNNVNTVKVFPNPANNALFINNGNLTSMAGYSIKITNSLGQIFFNEPVNQQQFFIDISTWATGTYLLYVINPQQAVVETKQVVLQ